MKPFVLQRRARALWAQQSVRRVLALLALACLVGLSLLLQDLSRIQVFEDQANELSIGAGEALLLRSSTPGDRDLLSFRGRSGRVVLVESPAAELASESRQILQKLGAPTPPEGLAEIFFGPSLAIAESDTRSTEDTAPGCFTAFTVRPASSHVLALRMAASVDPGGRPALQVEVVEGGLSVEVSTGLPAAHSAAAPGCQTELVVGSFRLVEQPPARQSLLVHSGGALTLTFETLVEASIWESGDRFEPFPSSLPIDLDGLLLSAESRPLLRIRAREKGLRLTDLVLRPGKLEASFRGHFEASGIRRPEGGRSRLAVRLGPVVDRLWQMVLASLYLMVFVGLKKALFPKSEE